MSRCFAYPPHGYVRNGVPDEPLIESMKLQSERRKAKTEQRKLKKREKKEKRREAKEKEKSKTTGISDNPIGGYLPKKIEDEAELEKSVLTEEHEQPISSQNLLYLSDSSQSSKKRKMDCSPSNGSLTNGRVVRIRFSFKKHREPDCLPSGENLSSTSGRADSLSHFGEINLPSCEDNNARTGTGADERLPVELPSSSGRKDSVAKCTIENACEPSKKEVRDEESLYKALIEDWVPPPISFGQNDDDDDQEWLFGSKRPREHRVEEVAIDGDALCSASNSLWPRANFLPSVSLYALPYTIPF